MYASFFMKINGYKSTIKLACYQGIAIKNAQL